MGYPSGGARGLGFHAFLAKRDPLLGGVRQDDLDKLTEQLRQLVPGVIAEDFARAVVDLAKSDEINDEELAIISATVDGWTVKVAAFAMEQDSQLDLTEAADGLLV